MTDWIEWNGGDCPVKSHRTLVDIKFINGKVDAGRRAADLVWTWDYCGHNGDIHAYRITEDHENDADSIVDLEADYDAACEEVNDALKKKDAALNALNAARLAEIEQRINLGMGK